MIILYHFRYEFPTDHILAKQSSIVTIKCRNCMSADLYLDPHAPKENKGHVRIQKVQRLCFIPKAPSEFVDLQWDPSLQLSVLVKPFGSF